MLRQVRAAGCGAVTAPAAEAAIPNGDRDSVGLGVGGVHLWKVQGARG